MTFSFQDYVKNSSIHRIFDWQLLCYILNIKIRPLVTEYALMIKFVDGTSSAHSFLKSLCVIRSLMVLFLYSKSTIRYTIYICQSNHTLLDIKSRNAKYMTRVFFIYVARVILGLWNSILVLWFFTGGLLRHTHGYLNIASR